MKTTWRLAALALALCGVRYLLLPDLAHALAPGWAPAARVELALLLVLYLALKRDAGLALTTAFWTGLLADTLLLGTLGLRSLVFLIVAFLPDWLGRYILVNGLLPTWVCMTVGLLLQAFLSPIVEPGPVGLLALLPTREFWHELGVYLLSNTLFLVPVFFALDSLVKGLKMAPEAETS